MKKTIDSCVQIVVFIIIFVDFMEIRISSEYVSRMKVLIFTECMYYLIVIIENIQVHYFDNLISKLCESVLNNDNTVKHQVGQYNALFLSIFSEPILVFVRTMKWKSTVTYWFERVLFTITYSLFHSNL